MDDCRVWIEQWWSEVNGWLVLLMVALVVVPVVITRGVEWMNGREE